MKLQSATAKRHGVSLFFGKNSRFEQYPSQPKRGRSSQKHVRYSVSKYHYDALIRKFYREQRQTDKTTSGEDLLAKVREMVFNHLEKNRLYYDLEKINKPVQAYPKTETYPMNMIQRAMYRRLMYGLSEFSPEQISDLSVKFENTIVREHRFTRQAVQILKAKKLYGVETRLINAIFQHSPIGDKDYEWIMSIPKKHTLRNLGISTKEILDELISRKLLPENYHTLDVTQVQL